MLENELWIFKGRLLDDKLNVILTLLGAGDNQDNKSKKSKAAHDHSGNSMMVEEGVMPSPLLNISTIRIVFIAFCYCK